MILKINEEVIIKRPLRTSTIASGLRFLLQEGQYSNLAKLLRFRKIDLQRIYISSFEPAQVPHMICAYELFTSGMIAVEDAKLLLPTRLVSDCSEMYELCPYELLKLPSNPLSMGASISGELIEETLIAALYRGLKERDSMMIWTEWPLQISSRYSLVWKHSEFWRILLIESFSELQIEKRRKFLVTLKNRIDKIAIYSHVSAIEMIMINVSLVAFYLDHCKMMNSFKSSPHVYSQLLESLDSLNDEFVSLFLLIKNNPIKHEILTSLSLKSINLVVNAPEHLHSNPFFYERRIEIFAEIIERLKEVPDIFADWFSNLFYAFSDVVPKMSLNLLTSAWKLFLSFKPSIGGLYNLISRIKEDYRDELVKMIPEDRLLLLYQNCDAKIIPSPLTLIPFEIREAEYLKKSRLGTVEGYLYDFRDFWQPNQQLPLILLLKIFQELQSNESISLDLYETIDTFFILENYSKPIPLRKFIEIALNLFMKVKEWYIPLEGESNEIIPSPLFPPQFTPFLAQLLVRCRHLMCQSPFKISESYLILAANGAVPEEMLKKFVKSQVNYLLNSSGSRLPKLTNAYSLYYDIITRIHEQQAEYSDFFSNHYALFKTINYLWRSETDLQQGPLDSDVEEKIFRSVKRSLELFGRELHKLMGRHVFADKDIYRFLYK